MKQSGLIVACILLLCGCKPQFEKIDYGKESCSHCKMTIVDKRFAAEMITSKGRTHKFDDVLCMKQYADYYTEQSKDAMYFVAVCNSNSEEFTDATKALYLQHQAFKSPMNGNYGAFSSTESAAATVKELNTQPVSWRDIK